PGVGEGQSPPSPAQVKEEPQEGGEGQEPPPGCTCGRRPPGVSGPALQEVLGALLSSAHGPALIGCAQCPPGGPKVHLGPCDLRAVNHRLEGGAYASLQEFAQDVASVLLRGGRGSTSPAPSPGPAPSLDGAKELFLKVGEGSQNSTPPVGLAPALTTPPFPRPGEEGAEPAVPQAAGGGGADERQCTLCLQSGDAPAQDEGRLLYMGQNEWTHVNCALWSAEVFEEGDGTLRNVHAAVARGRQM
ncbi:KMT2B methyltransferase, partial [Molothrus ater]|nr:KMT2B methyltransferase [Molothrus ater]